MEHLKCQRWWYPWLRFFIVKNCKFDTIWSCNITSSIRPWNCEIFSAAIN